MSLRTSRAYAPAEVTIDHERCNNCLLCAKVCNLTLYAERGKVRMDPSRLWGCIGCGQCVCVCPEDAIRVEGRDFHTSDTFPMAPREERADYRSLLNLLQARRSIRRFRPREIPPEVVEQLIDAASTAPMGIPPSDVSLIVFRTRGKVAAYAADLLDYMKRTKWMFSPWAMPLMRPMMGKEGYESMKGFINPLVDAYLEKSAQGEDLLFYGAPLAIYFYGSPYADPADPIIAATCAMIAAESLGLGSCMIGLPGWGMKYDRRLREKYGVPKGCQPGIVVIFGYPDVKYLRAVRRRFASVREV